MRHTSFLTAILLAGCVQLDDRFGPQANDDCGFLFESHPCVALGLNPKDSAIVLLGDTVLMMTWSDRLSNVAQWTIMDNDSSVAFLVNGATVPSAGPASRVTVKVLKRGTATVRAAVHPNLAQTRLRVADTSVVAVVRFVLGTEQPSVRVGSTSGLAFLITDSLGKLVTTLPIVTASDTTVAVIEHQFNALFGHMTLVRGRKTGTTPVIAAVGARSDTVTFTVVPQ